MKRFFYGVLLYGLLIQLVFGAETAQRWTRITIFHTNDTHGNLLPFSYPEKIDSSTQESGLRFKTNIGGAARRATMFKQWRAEFGDLALFVDCGDFMDGTPFSLQYKGSADVAVMNSIGYDFGTLGNHEFNNTAGQVKKLVKDAQFKFLCANVKDRKTGEPLCPPSTIIERGGVKIALFGLVTYDTRTYPAAEEGIDVLEPVEIAKALVPELRKQADVVILLSHLGIQDEERIARQVPGIDAIIGGHSHTRLTEPRFIPWQGWQEAKTPNLGATIMVQAHQWGGEIGRLDLLFGRDADTNAWTVIGYKGQLIPVTSEVPEEPKTAKIVQKYWKPIAKRYGEVVGEATDDFVSRGDDLAHYYLVNDAVMSEMNVDFDLQNVSGIRIQLAKGPIQRYDLAKMMPFGNTVVRFEITGRDLKTLLSRRNLTAGGIRFKKERGNITEITVQGQPLEEDRIYKGTANSYLAKQFLVPLNVPYIDTNEDVLEVVSRYIRKQGKVSPQFDGRRMVN